VEAIELLDLPFRPGACDDRPAMPLLTGPSAAWSARLPAEVQYVVDASDVLVEVNDAWSVFAIGNGAAHLAARHVLGRSLWTFVADERTCELYRSVMHRVREGGAASSTSAATRPSGVATC
jgi:hypothetical protein